MVMYVACMVVKLCYIIVVHTCIVYNLQWASLFWIPYGQLEVVLVKGGVLVSGAVLNTPLYIYSWSQPCMVLELIKGGILISGVSFYCTYLLMVVYQV